MLTYGRHYDDAERVVRSLLDQARKEYVSPYDIALVYTGLGDRDQALYWLGKAFEVRDQEMLHLSLDPLLDSLHDDPRFNMIVSRRP